MALTASNGGIIGTALNGTNGSYMDAMRMNRASLSPINSISAPAVLAETTPSIIVDTDSYIDAVCHADEHDTFNTDSSSHKPSATPWLSVGAGILIYVVTNVHRFTSEQTSERCERTSEQANGQVSGVVLTSGFLIIPAHCAGVVGNILHAAYIAIMAFFALLLLLLTTTSGFSGGGRESQRRIIELMAVIAIPLDHRQIREVAPGAASPCAVI